MNGDPAKKGKSTRSTWLIASVAAVVIFTLRNWTHTPPRTEASPDSPSPVTEAESLAYRTAQLERTKNAEVVLDAANFALQLKSSARNPDSFVVEQIIVNDLHAICLQYRAQNGFGGMNRDHAFMVEKMFLTSASDDFEQRWNRACGGREGRDITKDVFTLIARNAK